MSKMYITINRRIVDSVECKRFIYYIEEELASLIKECLDDLDNSKELSSQIFFDSFYLDGYVVSFENFRKYGLGEITHKELMKTYIYDDNYIIED